MTRKDYVLIAAALKDALPSAYDSADINNRVGASDMHATCVAMIANRLAQDNPRFDRARFLKAAGVAS